MNSMPEKTPDQNSMGRLSRGAVSNVFSQGQQAHAGYEYSPEEEIHLRDYWRVISKRRWTVITVFVIVLITTTISTFRMVPIYQATTKIQIDRENPNVIKIEEVMNLSPSDRDYNQTQFKLLQSRNLARMVIERLHLDKSPEFVSPEEEETSGFLKALHPKTIISSITSFLKSLFQTEKSEKALLSPDPDEEEEAKMFSMVNAFLGRLKVEPERNTRLVNVSFSGKHPKIVTKITDQDVLELSLQSRC